MIEECIIRDLEELYTDITLLEFNDIKETFKEQYNKITSSQMRRRCKRLVFSSKMADYKKEKIWEYLNGDIDDGYFEHFVEGVHAGWFK